MPDLWRSVSDEFGLSEEVEEQFRIHQQYMTADVLFDGECPIACIRYNIEDEGKTAYVLDLFCKERGVWAIRQFIARGRDRFPLLERAKFERQSKYPGRTFRYVCLDKLTKR